MSFSFNHYRLIRQNTIKMLYERSQQPNKRFHFQEGSLQLFEMMPDNILEEIYHEETMGVERLNYEYANDNQRVMFCFLSDLKNIVGNAIKLREKYLLESADTLILIVLNSERPEKRALDINVNNTEVFWFKELCFCITEHELVPRHTLLDENQKYELKRQLSLKNFSQIPTVLKNDPISKWFGAKEGDLFHILRESPNVGYHNFYRLVVGLDTPAQVLKTKNLAKKKGGLESILEGNDGKK